MQPITPTIRFMTPEETRTNNLINAGRVIDYRGNTIPIAAGSSDRIHVFKRIRQTCLQIKQHTSPEEFRKLA